MSKKILVSILSIVVIGVLLIAGATFFVGDDNMVTSASSRDSRENVLVVYGEGEVTIKPDIAYINVGVETLEDDAKKAQDVNKATMTKVIAKLKSMGIDEKDIKTANYSVEQEIDYSNNKRRLLGYRVYNTVKITVREIDKVGEILNAAYSEGANNIYGISFDVADRSEIYRQALEKAIDDAKGKAEVMAKQAGVKIGKPVGIYEGHQQDIIYGRNAGMKQMMDMDTMEYSSVPMETGELEIRADVTVEYQY